jgi:hypothetical protein
MRNAPSANNGQHPGAEIAELQVGDPLECRAL